VRRCRLIFAPSAIDLQSSFGEADPPCPLAREELIPPSAARQAATNNNKQRTARNRDGVDVRFASLIMDISLL
jgi:hypothetical protein